MARFSASAGRVVTVAVAGLLVLMVLAGVYVFFAQRQVPPTSLGVDELTQQEREHGQLITMLTVLLVSALLILLFVIGAYLVIRIGQFISRERVGGKATEYVDAWQQYRLTDAEISAATDEPPEQPPDGRPPRERPPPA